MSYGKSVFLSIILIWNIFRSILSWRQSQKLVNIRRTAYCVDEVSLQMTVVINRRNGTRWQHGRRKQNLWQRGLSWASYSLEHRGLLAKWQERPIGPATIPQPHAVHWSFSGEKGKTVARARGHEEWNQWRKNDNEKEISRWDWRGASGIHRTKRDASGIHCTKNFSQCNENVSVVTAMYKLVWYTWSVDILKVKGAVVLKHVSVHK